MENPLKDYFNAEPRGAMRRMADALQVNPALLSQWAAGDRPVHPKYIPAIEALTGGAVRRWDLTSDWSAIWPELVGSQGAPDSEQCISSSSAPQPKTEAGEQS